MRLSLVGVFAFVLTLSCGGGNHSGGASSPTASQQPTPTPEPSPPSDGNTTTPTPPASGIASQPYAFVGRFNLDDPKSAAYGQFAWPGSAVGSVFTGTSVSVKISDSGAMADGKPVFNWFDAQVDNQNAVVITTQAGVTEYPIASNLAPGQHTVWVRKRTEAWLGATRFLGFTTDGQIIGSPVAKTRRLEFIGASTECGYGDTESLTPPDGCLFTPGTENANLAYPALVAATLDADYANISYSGKGVYQNIYPQQSSITMPQIYGLVDPNDPGSTWSFSWTPQAVVMDMGGNDFEAYDNSGRSLSPPPQTDFVNAYVGFLKTIRSHYPDAFIWCVVSPIDLDDVRTGMQMDIGAAISQTGDAKIFLYSLPAYNGPTYGCENHPDAALHASMAQLLVAQIRTQLPW